MKIEKHQQKVIDKLYDDQEIDLKESLMLEKILKNNDEFFDSLPDKACDIMIGLCNIRRQHSRNEWEDGLEQAVNREDYEEAAIIKDLLAFY